MKIKQVPLASIPYNNRSESPFVILEKHKLNKGYLTHKVVYVKLDKSALSNFFKLV